MNEPQLLRPEWPAPGRVHSAFTLRGGGVSTGPYASLNIGTHVGDDPDFVQENRSRVRASLSLPHEPIWLEQVHGTEVLDLDVLGQGQPLLADAIVTRASERVCAIQVADCMPVLFASRDGTVIGAAHAGWRGLAGGVLEATVLAMQVAAADLAAWLGPAIGPEQFEVGEEVRAAFVSRDVRATTAFNQNPRGRWQCNLYTLARLQLSTLGIGSITGGGWCTYSDAQRFFSFRRDRRCGRMAALVWLA